MKLTTPQLLILLGAVLLLAVVMFAGPASSCSCRGAEPSRYDYDAQAALALASAARAKVVATVPTPFPAQTLPQNRPYVSPPNYHRHMDSQGNVFEHHDSNFGKPGPHHSPWTGEIVYPIYSGPKAPTPPPKPVARPPVPLAFAGFGAWCPPGAS